MSKGTGKYGIHHYKTKKKTIKLFNPQLLLFGSQI